MDAHGCHVTSDRHKSILDRPWPHTGENVAAVLAIADFGFVDHHLQEQIIDIGVRHA